MKSVEKGWQKVLYKKQPFADNYVPPTFLKDLRTNVNIRYYSYREIIVKCTAVTQEICSIILFIVVFMLLKMGQPSIAVFVCVFIATITLLLYVTLIIQSKHSSMFFELKNAFIFLFGGFAVSPILKTLTETISIDTIYTMVTLTMLLHLVSYDYGAKAAIVSTSLSLNAAIFGAVCLASQLSTIYHVFALLILASDVFVLFSIIRRQMRDNSSQLTQCIITTLLAVSAFISLYIISGT
ncbi:phosphatidylinositol N-acetylglucosaminyltransferase subunit C-like protein, partial [Leptotrombidium deliense]